MKLRTVTIVDERSDAEILAALLYADGFLTLALSREEMEDVRYLSDRGLAWFSFDSVFHAMLGAERVHFRVDTVDDAEYT